MENISTVTPNYKDLLNQEFHTEKPVQEQKDKCTRIPCCSIVCNRKKSFKNQPRTSRRLVEFMEAYAHHFMYDASVTIKKNGMNLRGVIWKELQGMILILLNKVQNSGYMCSQLCQKKKEEKECIFACLCIVLSLRVYRRMDGLS